MKKPLKISKPMKAYLAIQRRYRLACELRTMLVQDLNVAWAELSTKDMDAIMRGETPAGNVLESKAPTSKVMT